MREFKVADAADQQFTAILGNRRCTIRLRYNTTAARWMMDLSIDDRPVLTGRRVVVGTDLLAPYDLGVGAIFAFPEDPTAAPGRDELPSGAVRLYHATASDIASIAA